MLCSRVCLSRPASWTLIQSQCALRRVLCLRGCIKSRTVAVSLVPHVHKHVNKREYTYILNMHQHVNSREYTYRDHITNISVIKNHHRSRRTTRTAFGHSKTSKTPMVRSYSQAQHTCQRNTTRRGQRRQKTRKTQTMYLDNIREWPGLEPQELCDAAYTTVPDGERSQCINM